MQGELVMKGKQKKSGLNYNIEDLMKKGEELAEKTKKSEDSVIYALSCYAMEDLKDIAKKHGLKGYSKLKKKELTNVVIGCILDEDIAKEYFMNAKEKEYDFFDRLYNGKLENETIGIEQYLYWVDGGYLFIHDDVNITILNETKALYKKINTKAFRKKRKSFRMVSDYLLACKNLYGIISLDKFLEIYNEQNEDKIKKNTVLDVFQALSESNSSLILQEDNLIESSLIECDEYDILKDQQEGKPFYIPEQKVFLQYADDTFVEHNVQFENLKRYLIKNKKVEEELAVQLCEVIQEEFVVGISLQDVVTHFDEANITWTSEKQFNEMLEILVKCYNNTRMIGNRGYTPNEIAAFQNNEPAKKRNTLQNGVKIYPNDKCPCGSGKKYKYCCGR